MKFAELNTEMRVHAIRQNAGDDAATWVQMLLDQLQSAGDEIVRQREIIKNHATGAVNLVAESYQPPSVDIERPDEIGTVTNIVFKPIRFETRCPGNLDHWSEDHRREFVEQTARSFGHAAAGAIAAEVWPTEKPDN